MIVWPIPQGTSSSKLPDTTNCSHAAGGLHVLRDKQLTFRPDTRVRLPNILCQGVCTNGEANNKDGCLRVLLPDVVDSSVYISCQGYVHWLGTCQWRSPTAPTQCNTATVLSWRQRLFHKTAMFGHVKIATHREQGMVEATAITGHTL